MPPLLSFLILIFGFSYISCGLFCHLAICSFLWFRSVMFPSFIVFFNSLFVFMIIILLLSSPNTIWYLFAVLTVMFNSVCKWAL